MEIQSEHAGGSRALPRISLTPGGSRQYGIFGAANFPGDQGRKADRQKVRQGNRN